MFDISTRLVFVGRNGRTGGSRQPAVFLLYVLSEVSEDLSKAELMHSIAAAWLPVFVGGLTSFFALLYREDG